MAKVFSLNVSPSNEYSGLISFRIDWLDLLGVQGTFKSLLHHSSKASILKKKIKNKNKKKEERRKASILQHSGFFVVQLSHPYMTTGKMSVVLKKWPRVISVNGLHLNDCLHSLSFDPVAPLTNINRVTKISHSALSPEPLFMKHNCSTAEAM